MPGAVVAAVDDARVVAPPSSPVPQRLVAAGDRSARRPAAIGALTWVVLLVGVAMSAALGVVLKQVYDDNEARLLQQRTLEAAAVLMAAVPGIESPLAATAEFSEATDGDVVAPFRRLLGRIVERGTHRALLDARGVYAQMWALQQEEEIPATVPGSRPEEAPA